ncbi:hypothetical protein CROQUDRAFT_93190 [Cronartium quercuum f. sp. fusiforme G11]|uniref:Uncharacterized protein n=1 Tax=Cronartium quercuum f. sp. fusiforme G11 TaxID=708437 RepID=A0A9P6NHE9_9BASI|nr:hypothetical protein CROQUDRAFT_93190 [Cronartium quercuum f. sp. fusiforme G11]
MLLIMLLGLLLADEEQSFKKLDRRHTRFVLAGRKNDNQTLTPPKYCRTDVHKWAALEVRGCGSIPAGTVTWVGCLAEAAAKIRAKHTPAVQCHTAVAVLNYKQIPTKPPTSMSGDFLRQAVTKALATQCSIDFKGTNPPHETFPANHNKTDNQYLDPNSPWSVEVRFGAVDPGKTRGCATFRIQS